MAGTAAATLDDLAARLERRRVELPLAGPAAGEPVREVVLADLAGCADARQAPGGAGGILDGDVFLRLVFDGGPAPEHALVHVDAVVKVHEERLLDVAQRDLEGLAVVVPGLLLVDVFEDNVTVAAGEGGFEGRLGVELGSPAGVL